MTGSEIHNQLLESIWILAGGGHLYSEEHIMLEYGP